MKRYVLNNGSMCIVPYGDYFHADDVLPLVCRLAWIELVGWGVVNERLAFSHDDQFARMIGHSTRYPITREANGLLVYNPYLEDALLRAKGEA